jgi:hypothetical protein
MTGFFIKKAFFDGWDNLLQITVSNVVLAALLLGSFFLISLTAAILPLSIAVFLLCLSAIMMFCFAVSSCAARVASFKQFSLKDLFLTIPQMWKPGLLFGLIVGCGVLVLSIGLPFYMEIQSLLGIFPAAVLFWVTFVCLLSFQWVFPLYSQMNDSFFKSLKKSFIIFFDNPLFSFFMFLYNLVMIAISVFTLFLIPGVSGMILAANEALRLRLYKYDWMEQNPDMSAKEARRSVPWNELIADDRDTLGDRSLKSFIFPWKE